MPAPSLHDLCRKSCINNINSLTDVGDIEYHQISDILFYLKSPEQLHQIEELSPQIKGLDMELWQRFIANEIPKWEDKNYAPKNPLKWYEVYKRYKREQAAEIKRDEEILRETMMGIKRARDSNLSKVVDLGSLPKLPRDPRMTPNNGGVPISRSSLKKETLSFLSFGTGSRTKMKEGKSVLTRARREAKEISQMGKLSRPTHQLSIGQVTQAPAAMIKEYRTANKPATKIISRRTSAKLHVTEETTLEDREKRLRALTCDSKSNGITPNYIDVEDESESDYIKGESLHRSHEMQSQRSVQSRTTNLNSKQPPNFISTMTAQPKKNPRYVTDKPNLASLVRHSSSSIAPTSHLLSVDNTSTTKSTSIRSSTPQISAEKFKTSPLVGSQKSNIHKKRKQVDIFNHNASKRSKAL